MLGPYMNKNDKMTKNQCPVISLNFLNIIPREGRKDQKKFKFFLPFILLAHYNNISGDS